MVNQGREKKKSKEKKKKQANSEATAQERWKRKTEGGKKSKNKKRRVRNAVSERLAAATCRDEARTLNKKKALSWSKNSKKQKKKERKKKKESTEAMLVHSASPSLAYSKVKAWITTTITKKHFPTSSLSTDRFFQFPIDFFPLPLPPLPQVTLLFWLLLVFFFCFFLLLLLLPSHYEQDYTWRSQKELI